GRAHLGRAHGLHRCRGADRHEGGRTDLAPHHANDAGTRGAIGRGELKSESVGHGARLWAGRRGKSRRGRALRYSRSSSLEGSSAAAFAFSFGFSLSKI